MRLKRLELQGFKSFLDRTILEFDEGITGVVGPNGCGKSNIVDAMMWVMGEQSAKHLRGESMSDVIFSGAEKHAPTSMAEVSLIMEARGANIPPHLIHRVKGEEIAVTRRLYRDGTAEYLLNKQVCRLKDIHELFMDTGVGRRAYSVIEQGQIDRMINVKPEDRRTILEEVAGITKYRAKKKEAERRLEATRLNIARVQDIVAELEKQMRSLKIQATRARKYREIKGELETIDLYVLGRKLFDLKSEIDSMLSEKSALTVQRSEMDARLSRAEAELTELDVKRVDEEKEIERLDEKERDLTLLIQRLENQLTLIGEQKKHLAQSAEALTAEEAGVTETVRELEGESEKVTAEQAEAEASVSQLEAQIQADEERFRTLQEDKRRLDSEKEDLQSETSTLSQREVYLQNQTLHVEKQKENLSTQIDELNEKLTETVVVLDAQKENLKTVDEKIEACMERASRLEADVATVAEDYQQTSVKLSAKEEELFKLRDGFHVKKSRADSLKELQENLEGYSPTAKEILSRLEGGSFQAVPLPEVLKPQAEVEDHVEAVLADAFNTLLVESELQERELARLIEEKGLERVSIIATEGLSESETRSDCPLESLYSKVGVQPGYEKVASKYLSNVFFCENLDELFQYRRQYPGIVLITRDGKNISHAQGGLTCGTVQSKTGVFARRREIEELEVQCVELKAQVDAAVSERESLLSHLEEREKKHTELKDTLSTVHISRVEHRKEREKVQAELDRADKDYTALSEQSSRSKSQLDEAIGELESYTAESVELAAKKETLENSSMTCQAELESVQEQIEEATLGMSEKRIERSKLDERVEGLSARIAKVGEELSRYEERRKSIAQKRIQEAEQLSQLETQQDEVDGEVSGSKDNRNTVLAKLSDYKDAHTQTSTRLTELRLQKDEVNRDREGVGNQIQEFELRLTQTQSDFEHQKSISLERYQHEASPIEPGDEKLIDLDKLPLLKGQVRVDWNELTIADKMSLLDEHIGNLRKKAERYGEVNLTAIQEFEEVEKRHAFLTEQKDDLENSIQILESAIKRIDETTKTRFAETLTGVNEKFKEVFPILFNGGKAELSLTDPTNILESGVDIMVQPPGKRLQSITLLSGGEKALTAVSLILAIFARKPSPFCLLDEVDAPLDDANVSRFNTVVQHMATKSQFILITHNRRTMEMADALYGVTMERAGISKMTSVHLH